MSQSICISGRHIGRDFAPFIIAEMSGNHNQSLARALEIVEAAASSGARALKIQTYTPDTMTLDLDEGDFHISNPDSPWAGTSLYDCMARRTRLGMARADPRSRARTRHDRFQHAVR